jgi:prenyltransferase beta subunit
VDVCYSYWIAACFPALENNAKEHCLFNTSTLQKYILEVCQNSAGGFSDKPNK